MRKYFGLIALCLIFIWFAIVAIWHPGKPSISTYPFKADSCPNCGYYPPGIYVQNGKGIYLKQPEHITKEAFAKMFDSIHGVSQPGIITLSPKQTIDPFKIFMPAPFVWYHQQDTVYKMELRGSNTDLTDTTSIKVTLSKDFFMKYWLTNGKTIEITVK